MEWGLELWQLVLVGSGTNISDTTSEEATITCTSNSYLFVVGWLFRYLGIGW